MDFQGNEGFHQFHGVIRISGKIAVREEKVFCLDAPYFFYDVSNRAEAVAFAEIEPFGAKFTTEGASSGRLYGKSLDRAVPFEINEIVSRVGEIIENQLFAGCIGFFQSAPGRVFKHEMPGLIRFANPHGVCVRGGFFGMEVCVRSAHDHLDSPATELVGDVIRAERIDGPTGDGHNVRGTLEIDIHHLFVDERYIPFSGCEGGEIGQGQTHQPSFFGFINPEV